MQQSHKQSLIAAGLTPPQAAVYEALLRYGTQKAGTLTKNTTLKRGLIYKALDDLVRMDLVRKEEHDGTVTRFHPEHPSNLRRLAEERKQKALDAQLAINTSLGALISEFNLASGKPGVEFFEGEEGVEKVLADSLVTTGDVYVIADIEAVVNHINDINTAYVRKREKMHIKKKALILDTPFAQKYMKTYHREITNTRLLRNENAKPFHALTEIYDDKISYITFEEHAGKEPLMIGVIIQDRAIHHMHKYLFEVLWRNAHHI